MPQQYRNKIIYFGETLIDLTADTADSASVLRGATFHAADGSPQTGTCDFDMDTSNFDATASEILSGKTAGVNGNSITGTMPNNGGTGGTISTKAGEYTIPQGYADGSGKVSISSTEQAKIIAENIREGITILGVLGTMSGSEDVHAEEVTATPSNADQTITPGTGYNYISQVTVLAVPYTETSNAAGGLTVTIGTSA